MTTAMTTFKRQPSSVLKSLELFKTLEFVESRKRSLWMSVAVHGVVLSVLLAIPLIFTDRLKVKFNIILIAPPMPKEQVFEETHYKQLPNPKRLAVPKPLVVLPPAKPVLIELPELKQPEPANVAEIKSPEIIEFEKPVLDSIRPGVVAPKAAEVRTGLFSTESSGAQTANRPVQKIQTGGFDGPIGLKGEGNPGRLADIASLSSFDLPVGSGTRGSSERGVHQAGFGDVDGTAKPKVPEKHVEAGPPQIPVEILFKPRPDYTEEARKAKLEGEVLVRVLFSATGGVRVLDVVRGLGHGLDENAVRAVQQIKFRPAQRDGQPVDATATVHIVFQLAY
jgi:TonB family protein